MLEVQHPQNQSNKSFKRKFDSIHSDEDDEIDDDGEPSFLHSRKKRKRGSYKCSKCGEPKKGHKCRKDDYKKEYEEVNNELGEALQEIKYLKSVMVQLKDENTNLKNQIMQIGSSNFMHSPPQPISQPTTLPVIQEHAIGQNVPPQNNTSVPHRSVSPLINGFDGSPEVYFNTHHYLDQFYVV